MPSYLFKVTLLTMEFGGFAQREREREWGVFGNLGVLEGYEEGVFGI